ncbi:hypothetical protein G7Y89_g2494 [Cudoniella acicularis]|uniref:Cytochrome P450 n=1 Tax=Cudoniella acicularis TaxID=354080 RepID=A0A8H4RV93_9HELO|nr:hypothetical protein G7Y89_g2494 [Cudoniella acicularis]
MQTAHPETVTDLVINGYVVLPLLAGADTIAIVLGTIVYNLGRYPRVAAKLHDELYSSNIHLHIPPKFVDVHNLPYMGAVIREALHIHPISTFLSRRVIPTSDGLMLPDGIVLLPSTTVAISPWLTHFNTQVYGTDAENFNPKRWLKAADKPDLLYENKMRGMNRTDLAWGDGYRSYLGKNIAKCEMYKLIATLYSVFDVSLLRIRFPGI